MMSVGILYWYRKFACAIRGVRRGIQGQSSFLVHGMATFGVLSLATALRLPRTDWCLLMVCITLVWSAELFNSALELLVRAISRESHPGIADALDTASGAVLLAALGAAVVGSLVLGPAVVTQWFARK